MENEEKNIVQPEVSTPEVDSSKVKTNRSKWLGWLLGAVVLVGVGYGIYYLKVQSSNVKTTNQNISTTDWKTYDNKEFGFSFKYPKEFGEFHLTISDKNGTTEISKNPILSTAHAAAPPEKGKQLVGGFDKQPTLQFTGLSDDFYLGRGSAGIQDFYGYTKTSNTYSLRLVENSTFKPVSVINNNGIEILRINCSSFNECNLSEDSPTPGGYLSSGFGGLINLNGSLDFKGIAIVGHEPEISEPIFDQILSTIKFAKTAVNEAPTTQEPTATTKTDPTTGWKTYENKDYGFSFKYPSDATISDISKPEVAKLLLTVNGVDLSINKNFEGGVEGYGEQNASFPDNRINGFDRNVRGYDSDAVTDSMYSYFITNVKSKDTVMILAFIEKDKLNKSNIDLFDQILSTFKFTP